MSSKYIGGFFALDLRNYRSDLDFSKVWCLPHEPNSCFTNARSALAAMLIILKPPRIFLPSYICRSVADAVRASGVSLSYYRVDEMLEPDVDSLSARTQVGDCVLAVDYFGRPPKQAFLDFVRSREDLLFVEDSVQALDTGIDPWGTWRLFSPRKLIGVADGGFIVSSAANEIAVEFQSVSEPDIDLVLAPLLRFEDESDAFNAKWHQANQTRETNMVVSDSRMTVISRSLLSGFDPQPVIDIRKSNFSILANALENVAYFNEKSPAFCPFGFPIRVPADLRSEIREKLINRRIFPAVHWREIPSSVTDYPESHRLAQELLTLPCDQRYESSDMAVIADTVRNCLGAH